MTQITRRKLIATAAGAAAAAPMVHMFSVGSAQAMGASHEVQMLNKHPETNQPMQFFPNILQVNAGDTVKFVSTDRGHNTKSIKGMVPDGADDWDSKINDDVELTFDTPGFYGFLCTPHSATGMVGLIVVEGEGKLDNLEAAQKVKHRGKARKVWKGMWEEAESMGLLEATPAA